MWATRRDESSSASWRSEKELGAASRGVSRGGRGRGGGRSRAGGRGGRNNSERRPIDIADNSKASTRLDRTPANSRSNRDIVKTLTGSAQTLAPETSAKPTIPPLPVLPSLPNQNAQSNANAQTADPTNDAKQSNTSSQTSGQSSNNNNQSNVNDQKIEPITKGVPRRSSAQRLPSLKVDAMDSSSSVSQPKSPGRRRRNTQSHKRTPSAVVPKALPSATLSIPQPSKVAVPPHRDAPPHAFPGASPVQPVHNIRQDIDSLVERVRATAMESHRPSSPSTHIDWAGDDDDSLPDLDDWGFSSKKMNELSDAASKGEDSSPPSSAVEPAGLEKLENMTSSISTSLSSSPATGSASDPKAPAAEKDSIIKGRGERKRERGRGKERERKAAIPATNGVSTAQQNFNNTSKKSLLQRLSSPVRPESSTQIGRLDASPSRMGVNGTTGLSGPTSTLPHHPSLPPKPITSAFGRSPNTTIAKSNGVQASHPINPQPSWKAPGFDKSPTKSTFGGASGVQPSEELDATPESKPETDLLKNDVDTNEPGTTPESKREGCSGLPLEGNVETKESALSSSLQVDVEPPTPADEAPNALVPLLEDMRHSPRSRTQRPLSGDITPRAVRDRSPYKTHNARNHSAPHIGLARVRNPHTTRPVLRMDALAMISRSLRESPTPPRRESPAPSTISAAE